MAENCFSLEWEDPQMERKQQYFVGWILFEQILEKLFKTIALWQISVSLRSFCST